MLFMSGDGTVYLRTTYGSIAVPTNSATNTILTKTFTTLGQSNAGLRTIYFENVCLAMLLAIVGTTASYRFNSSSPVDPTIFLNSLTTNTVYGLSE
jgi:hypothetical protein